jgi:hypothetical protein
MDSGLYYNYIFKVTVIQKGDVYYFLFYEAWKRCLVKVEVNTFLLHNIIYKERPG